MDPLQCSDVPGNAVVRIVAAEHLIKDVCLFSDRQVRIRRIWSCNRMNDRRKRDFSVCSPRRAAVYTRCLRCACSSMPKRPTTSSELSLLVFRSMSSSETTGNFPVALTQYFTGNAGLRHGINVSAFPSPSHSDPGEECFSRLNYGSLALRPVALLALLSEHTRLSSSRRGRLHPGFRQLGHPCRRQI
jgi:hypothetical protein